MPLLIKQRGEIESDTTTLADIQTQTSKCPSHGHQDPTSNMKSFPGAEGLLSFQERTTKLSFFISF